MNYFYWYIHNLYILSNEDLNLAKAKTKKAALSSYRNYNDNVPQNITNDEFIGL